MNRLAALAVVVAGLLAASTTAEARLGDPLRFAPAPFSELAPGSANGSSWLQPPPNTSFPSRDLKAFHLQPPPEFATQKFSRNVKGHFKVVCVAVKRDGKNQNPGRGQCRKALALLRFFERWADGRVSFSKKTGSISVRRDMRPTKARNLAIRAAGRGADFVIVIDKESKRQSGGRRVARIRGTSAFLHEMGHLLNLGHAGAMRRKNGKKRFDRTGDAKNIMSRFADHRLNAVQLLWLGWRDARTQYAVHRRSYASQKYVLKRETAPADAPGLMGVIIPPEEFGGGKRFAMVTFPTGCSGNGCMALLLSNGGGSHLLSRGGRLINDQRTTGIMVQKLRVFDDPSGARLVEIGITLPAAGPAS